MKTHVLCSFPTYLPIPTSPTHPHPTHTLPPHIHFPPSHTLPPHTYTPLKHPVPPHIPLPSPQRAQYEASERKAAQHTLEVDDLRAQCKQLASSIVSLQQELQASQQESQRAQRCLQVGTRVGGCCLCMMMRVGVRGCMCMCMIALCGCVHVLMHTTVHNTQSSCTRSYNTPSSCTLLKNTHHHHAYPCYVHDPLCPHTFPPPCLRRKQHCV